MEKFYIRSSDLEQKIHSVKLPYLAWKVLFLLGEKQTIENLADLLDESQPDIAKAIALLTEQNLVKEAEAAEVKEAEQPPVEEKSTEKVELEKEETVAEKEELEAEEPIEEEPAETTETVEVEKVTEKPEPELAEQEEAVEEESALEEDEEFKGIGDFELPELEEESDLEEETSELESQISELKEPESEIELPQVEEETEKLDVDFESIEEPVVEEKAAAEEEKAERVGAPGILVIDDSIVIRKMVELALEGEDFILETATSGKEGLKKLDEIKPDIVILDLMLPDINGIDLLKTIKASLGIPVIMLSGKDSPQMIEKAKAEGADAFLPKPFRDEDLVKTIHELLEK